MASPPSVHVQTRQSSPLTQEDLEAERRYQQAVAYRSQSAPASPINSRHNRPPLAQALDLQVFDQYHPDISSPPSPPASSSSGASLQNPGSDLHLELDTNSGYELTPPNPFRGVTNMTPCARCGKPYAPDSVFVILDRAMEEAPGDYARSDWADAKYEDRWAPHLRSLTRTKLAKPRKLDLTKERMDSICGQCILNSVSKAQHWPRYDVERKVWSWSHKGAERVLSL
jgi:hypothetical protein